MAIRSFADKETQRFFETGKAAKGTGWSNVKDVARRKLAMVDYAAVLNDLKSPPNNKLEALSGNLAGLHSIRINDQWRVVFRWAASGVTEVQIIDYH